MVTLTCFVHVEKHVLTTNQLKRSLRKCLFENDFSPCVDVVISQQLMRKSNSFSHLGWLQLTSQYRSPIQLCPHPGLQLSPVFALVCELYLAARLNFESACTPRQSPPSHSHAATLHALSQYLSFTHDDGQPETP